MTPTELFHRAHGFVRGYDVDGVAACFAPDGMLELPFAPPPLDRRYVGRDAIRALLAPRYDARRAAGQRIAGYRALVVHETADPQVIVVEFEIDSPGSPGRPLGFIQVFRFVDGLIALQRDYFDSQLMVERLRVS